MMAEMKTDQEEEHRHTRWHKKEEWAWELSALREEEAARDMREWNRRKEQHRVSLVQDQGRPGGDGGGAKSRQNAVVSQQQQQQQQQKQTTTRLSGAPPAQDMNAMNGHSGP